MVTENVTSGALINAGYPSAQLQAAVVAAERAAQLTAPTNSSQSRSMLSQNDPKLAAARETAQQAAAVRVRKWTDVMHGMATDAITVGSRQPVSNLPVWLTPEVAGGGFATGKAASGGPLLPHEIALSQEVGVQADRSALAAYYMSDDGLAYLRRILDSGGYKIELPEEAAFPVVAWLLGQGTDAASAAAVTLLDTLTPHMATLRFAPSPAPPSTADPTPTAHSLMNTLPLCYRTAQHAIQALKDLRLTHRLCQHCEAVTVWAPFYDEVLGLWLEVLTEDGDFREDEAPLPEEWCKRAGALVVRYQILEAQHQFAQKHRHPKRNNAVLRTALAVAVSQDGVLGASTKRQVSYRVACMLRKRGPPGGQCMHAVRESQLASVRLPQHAHLATLLVNRIEALQLPTTRGIPRDKLEDLLEPVTTVESTTATIIPTASSHRQQLHGKVAEGSEVPEKLKGLLKRSMEAPLTELIGCGVVPSAATLAEVSPRVTAAATAAQYADPVLARLMTRLQAAFFNRKSVLLLELQSQVKVTELPWYAAVQEGGFAEPGRVGGVASVLLRHLGEVALHAFPDSMLPNTLVQQLATLAQLAIKSARPCGIDTPEADAKTSTDRKKGSAATDDDADSEEKLYEGFVLLEELAADTFECAFAGKFAIAARQAAEMLQGTAYERYYGLDYRSILEKVPHASLKGPSVELYALCEELGGLNEDERVGRGRRGRGRGRFGRGMFGPRCAMGRRVGLEEKEMLIEQAQIVTTHNLAMLTQAGVTAGEGDGGWGALAERCATAVCSLTEIARVAKGHRVRYRWAKQAANAWRQMVFFLALEERREVHEKVVNVLKCAKKAEVAWVLQPKLRRLEAALQLHEGHNAVQCLSAEKVGKPLIGARMGAMHCEHRLLYKYE